MPTERPARIIVRKNPYLARWGDLIRRSGGWTWHCGNSFCTRPRAKGFGTQRAALFDACRHLAVDFDEHHDMVVSGLHYFAEVGRYRVSCRCGHVAEGNTVQAVEDSLHTHIRLLRRRLPSTAAS